MVLWVLWNQFHQTYLWVLYGRMDQKNLWNQFHQTYLWVQYGQMDRLDR